MTREAIIRLAEKVADGSASAEEIHLYNCLLDGIAMQEKQGTDETDFDLNALKVDSKLIIWKKAGLASKSANVIWYRWAAAAAIILIAGAFILFRTGKEKSDPAIAKVPVSIPPAPLEIPPGHNGAILTLANGQHILLDSAGNGVLTQQGNTLVTKSNGQLVYSEAGNSPETVVNTMSTPKGRQFSLVLSDGSRVWLNAASSITFPAAFTGKERKVTISGEAYFEVAHDAKKPFVVEKGNTSIMVLGTHFNVNAYDDEHTLNVTLLEGSVNVRNNQNSNTITPGQQVQVNKEGKLTLARKVDVENVVAWKNGRISFHGAHIEAVMRQMSRWYDVEIEYNRKLDDLFYADIPRTTNLQDLLKALELTKKVHFKVEGRKVIVVP